MNLKKHQKQPKMSQKHQKGQNHEKHEKRPKIAKNSHFRQKRPGRHEFLGQYEIFELTTIFVPGQNFVLPGTMVSP